MCCLLLLCLWYGRIRNRNEMRIYVMRTKTSEGKRRGIRMSNPFVFMDFCYFWRWKCCCYPKPEGLSTWWYVVVFHVGKMREIASEVDDWFVCSVVRRKWYKKIILRECYWLPTLRSNHYIILRVSNGFFERSGIMWICIVDVFEKQMRGIHFTNERSLDLHII